MERRTLIRLLIGLGIGVPILLEAFTFFGLVGRSLGDGDHDGGTPTDGPRRVGVGDELLPGTPARETVVEARVDASPDRWLFRFGVEVENTTDDPYELRLGEVTLSDGSIATGGGASGPVPPGASATVTGSWVLPPGQTPVLVDVTGVTDPDGVAATVERRIVLAKVPVRGA